MTADLSCFSFLFHNPLTRQHRVPEPIGPPPCGPKVPSFSGRRRCQQGGADLLTHRKLISDVLGPHVFVSDHARDLLRRPLQTGQGLRTHATGCCVNFVKSASFVSGERVRRRQTFSSAFLSALPSANPRIGSFFTSTAARGNVLNLREKGDNNHQQTESSRNRSVVYPQF